MLNAKWLGAIAGIAAGFLVGWFARPQTAPAPAAPQSIVYTPEPGSDWSAPLRSFPVQDAKPGNLWMREPRNEAHPEAFACIATAETATAFRVRRKPDAMSGWERSSYEIVGSGKPLTPTQLWRFKHRMLDPSGGPKTCAPTYGVMIRCEGPRGRAEVWLCFRCNRLAVFREGDLEVGWFFDNDQEYFVRLAQWMFPDVKDIAKLKPSDSNVSAGF